MMNIIDYSWKTPSSRENNPLLPQNLRGLIVGKSNCGKTTLLFNLILQDGWLDYDHLLVFGKSLHQKDYQIIKNGFAEGLSKNQISNLFVNQNLLKQANIDPSEAIDYATKSPTRTIKAEFFEDCSAVPDPKDLDATEKNLLILDDCFLGPQNKAEAFYTRGRHSNCDTIYISQNYFRLPRQTIRENANFIILFPQDNRNLNFIHADHCSDISIQEFKDFCQKVWTSHHHNFVVIDLTSQAMNGKYRRNLDCFYIPATTQINSL